MHPEAATKIYTLWRALKKCGWFHQEHEKLNGLFFPNAYIGLEAIDFAVSALSCAAEYEAKSTLYRTSKRSDDHSKWRLCAD
jgi:hypothetical protein